MRDVSYLLYADGRKPSIKVYENKGEDHSDILVELPNGDSISTKYSKNGLDVSVNGVTVDEELEPMTCGNIGTSSHKASHNFVESAGDNLKFWGQGNCYTDDSVEHSATVTIHLADMLVSDLNGIEQAIPRIEAIMANVSNIYLYQYNTRLRLKAIVTKNDIVTGTGSDAAYKNPCGDKYRLDNFVAALSTNNISQYDAGIHHLLIGCNGFINGSVRGLAYLGTFCFNSAYKSGVSAVKMTTKALESDIWVIAHEIGHNFNRSHPSPIMTPGIMGYSQPKIDGKLRFSADSGSVICNTLSRNKGKDCMKPTEDNPTNPSPGPFPRPTPSTEVPTGTPEGTEPPVKKDMYIKIGLGLSSALLILLLIYLFI